MELVKWEKAKQAIIEAHSVDEVAQIRDWAEAKRYALEEAASDGENKAYVIANSLDVEVDKVYYIKEIETYFPGPIYAREFAVEEAIGLEEVTPPPITPREIEITANIQIAFTFK